MLMSAQAAMTAGTTSSLPQYSGNSVVEGSDPSPPSPDLTRAHMRVVSVRDFRDRASEMFRSEDVILVTRDGAPAGFFLPWETPELPVEVRREVFQRLSEQIGAKLEVNGVTEQEVLDDFAAGRRRR
jgi:hypothetical protein